MRTLPSLLAVALLATTLAGSAAAQTGAAPDLPKVGSEFPWFSLPDVEGRPVTLASFKGKAIMLSFWSCHTDTCFTSVRVFDELLKEYGSRGLVAPTICSEVPPALEQDGYAGLLKRCSTGQVVLIDKRTALTRQMGIVEFPTTFLIDRNQTVWQVLTGVSPLMTEDFRSLVKSLVSE